MSEKKPRPKTNLKSHPCDSTSESASLPRPNRDKDLHSRKFYSSPDTNVPMNLMESSEHLVDDSTSHCFDFTTQSTTPTATSYVYERSQPFDQFSPTSIWKPNRHDYAFLSLASARPSISKLPDDIPDKFDIQDRSQVHSTPEAKQDSIICKLASDITTAIITTAITTIAITTTPVTTPAVTTTTITTIAITTTPVTTPAVTTTPITTPAVTTAAITTPAVTTAPITTPAITTPAVTTIAITTTASASSAQYSAIAASSIPLQRWESPKYKHRLQTNSEAKRITIFVEGLPDWTAHFRILTSKLGHSVNARCYGKGIQFIPKCTLERKIVESYLTNLKDIEPSMPSFSYTPSNAVPSKVGVRGLPFGTPLSELKEALEEIGLPVQLVQAIPSWRHSECLYVVELGHLSHRQLTRLFAIHELLHISGVIIEDISKTGSLQVQQSEIDKSVPTRKKQRETRKLHTDAESDQNKEDKGWIKVNNKKKVTAPLALPKKKLAGEKLPLNRYDTGIKISSPPNEPIGGNEQSSAVITKSKKRRDKKKNRLNFDELLYASSSVVDTGDEAAKCQDEARPVFCEEQNVTDQVDPMPSTSDGACSSSQGNAENIDNVDMETFNELLRTIAVIFAEIKRKVDEMNVSVEIVLVAIESYLEEQNARNRQEDDN